jgi:hypothetical protein
MVKKEGEKTVSKKALITGIRGQDGAYLTFTASTGEAAIRASGG